MTGIALLTAACGGVGDDSGDTEDGEPVRITTMGFGLPDEHATARVDAFREANKDVEVFLAQRCFVQGLVTQYTQR